jgi:hypothetical protein
MKTHVRELLSAQNHNDGASMQRILSGSILIGAMVLLNACASQQNAPLLPTATPAPTQIVPSSTPTLLPPPTVTPYPSIVSEPATIQLTEGTTEVTGSPAAGTSIATTKDPQETAAATSTTRLAPTAQPAGDLNLDRKIYSADFAQGWPTQNDTTVKMVIANGQYSFAIGPFDAAFRNTGVVNQADLYAKVEVTVSDCPEEAGYGLRFRLASNNDAYTFLAFCEGTYSLTGRVNGSLLQSPLASGSLPGSIDAKSGTHTLSILAHGAVLRIYFDDFMLAEAQDSRLDTGDVAIYALSEGIGIIEVAFDNLEVWTIH